jgi:N-methylhydantoinase B
MLVYRTAGGGGWKDRLDRPVEAVARDVAFGLVSREKALRGYGVVLDEHGTPDVAATEAERARQREERGAAPAFDFGPGLEETLAACEADTGLPAPRRAAPLRWSPLEDPEAARARVRAEWEAETAAGDGHGPSWQGGTREGADGGGLS